MESKETGDSFKQSSSPEIHCSLPYYSFQDVQKSVLEPFMLISKANLITMTSLENSSLQDY